MAAESRVEDFLRTPARQTAALATTRHRPWPLPGGPWLMAQTWKSLLFAHWPVAAGDLEEHVPSGLTLERWEGSAWLGLTPFLLTGLRVRATPPLPYASTFPELNVRTYVTRDGKPGIYFLSLDAGSRLAVEAARRAYRLPYFRARMEIAPAGDEVRFASARADRRGHPARFRAAYAPAAERFQARPGSLEYFLAERYCLYAFDRGRLLRADIHHPPWPLRPAEGEVEATTMPPPGLRLPAGDPLLHLAGRQDVVVWPPRPL